MHRPWKNGRTRGGRMTNRHFQRILILGLLACGWIAAQPQQPASIPAQVYPPGDWPRKREDALQNLKTRKLLRRWPSWQNNKGAERFIWYRVEKGPILEPLSCVKKPTWGGQDDNRDPGFEADCKPKNNKNDFFTPTLPTQNGNPLKLGDALIIAIYDPCNFLSAMTYLGLTVTTQSTSAATPAPLRSSISPTGGAEPRCNADRYYYLPWSNNSMPGDTIISVSVTAKQPDSGNTSGPWVPLLNATYPQSHKVSYYNIATGVIVSDLRSPSWSRQETAAAVNCTGAPQPCIASPALYQTIQNPSGSKPIFPALFFTVYWPGLPFDAERKWRLKDLIPAPSLGFSLSSPSSDFFFGGSVEVLRGVQIVGGRHVGKINELAPASINDPTSSTAPATMQRFHPGWFGGVTFQFTFIQSLFGGAKAGS